MMEDLQEMRNELLKSKVKDEQEATRQSKASINFVYQTQMTAGTASLSASWRFWE